MRSNRLRVCVAGALYYTGIVPAARWWARRRRQDLIVLCYHRASNGDLRRHLRYLSRHYHVLPLETALEQLGRADGDRRTRLAVTFDDGYRDNYTHAYAIARELGVPITVFVIPDYVGGERCFWSASLPASGQPRRWCSSSRSGLSTCPPATMQRYLS